MIIDILTKIKCHKCNKIFEVYNYRKKTAKYCSKKCWNTRGEKSIKKCPICQKEFIIFTNNKNNKKFCSKNCSGYSSSLKDGKYLKVNKTCKRCNKKYIGFVSSFFCSQKCNCKYMNKYFNWSKGKTKEDDIRILNQSIKSKKTKNLPENILKLSKEMKIKWKNKEWAEKQLTLMSKGLLENRRPTSFEKIIIKIIKKYNLPYKYTGDGDFWIGYKNPDFIRDDNKKICIEVFCNYYKIRDYGSVKNYEKQRSNHFKKYGYKTIFIREEEIKKENLIVNKLKRINND